MSVTPLKFFSAVSLIAVPLFATTFWCRPNFANAINNHLIQEEMEASRQHNYKSDFRERDLAHDAMLAEYVKKGDGHPREFVPSQATSF